MKVQNLIEGKGLDYEKIYNVFAISDWKSLDRKYYIFDPSTKGITPYDANEFRIVDTNISKFWQYWLDQFGHVSISIPEILDVKYFWERYYDDDPQILDIISLYKNIAVDLFNE